MHRQRSRFAARFSGVVGQWGPRGIVATYELHDRAVSNRRSQHAFARHRPARGVTHLAWDNRPPKQSQLWR